jgi:5-methyltetrahydrofolate--homocysteine methyltransferase
MLKINGFDVLDIGVDQPAENFIKAIKEFDPHVIGLSGLLTVAFTSMQKIVAEIEKAGLREGRKIMIGGSQMDDHVNKFVGTDAFGTDAMKAVELSRNWCEG